MANEYWLRDQQWVAIEPLIPMNRRGVKPGRNREVISGILHVLKFGLASEGLAARRHAVR
jgi:transposase